MCEVQHLETAERFSRHRNQIPNLIVLSLLLGLACLSAVTTACSAALQGSSANSAAVPTTAMSLSPNTATVASMHQIQFTAHLIGNSKAALTWSASEGTISSTGVFTAPQVTSPTRVTVTATTSANRTGPEIGVESSTKAVAAITVTPPAPTPSSLTITNSALPGASVSVPYMESLSAVGGVTPYQWSLVSGSLPPGFQLRSSVGAIVGTASTQGSYPVSVQVTDAAGHSATAGLSLTVTGTSMALAITNTFLPGADVSAPYSTALAATGGVAPYHWSLVSGSLPSGIQLQSSSGILNGTAVLAGSYPLSIQVTDVSGNHASVCSQLDGFVDSDDWV